MKSKAIFLFTLSILLPLFIGEMCLRSLYNWDPGYLVVFKSSKNDISTKKIKPANLNNFEEVIWNVLPPVRNYGVFRPESKELIKSYSGNNYVNLLRIWNLNFLKKEGLTMAKPFIEGYGNNKLYAFTPFDSSMFPAFRFFPKSKIPDFSLQFNAFGWSGSDISFKKPINTIRIAFLGGSTSQQINPIPFAYPDYVEVFLNKWAEINKLNINFEVINTGRAALRSMDFAAIYKYELVPVKPDIVLYYEGRNQFDLTSICNCVAFGQFDNNPIYFSLRHSILLQLTFSTLGISPYKLLESQKKNIKYSWNNTNELNPDPFQKELPVNLSQIIDDIEKINNAIDTNKQAFILGSFPMITDENALNNSPNIYGYWLHEFGTIPVKDIHRMNVFENRVFKNYASIRHILFADIEAELSKYPELFFDGIHLSEEGMKMHAWITFKKLIPLINQNLANGKWPDSNNADLNEHPFVKDNAFIVDLNSLK